MRVGYTNDDVAAAIVEHECHTLLVVGLKRVWDSHDGGFGNLLVAKWRPTM